MFFLGRFKDKMSVRQLTSTHDATAKISSKSSSYAHSHRLYFLDVTFNRRSSRHPRQC
jgi:hypothetical protein